VFSRSGFSAPFLYPPLRFALRRINPAPFSLLPRFRIFQIVVRDRNLSRAGRETVTIRPIAAPAAPNEAEDERLAAEPWRTKRNAQSFDAARSRRNDVARRANRVVEVTEKFAIERYSHVMHIFERRGSPRNHDVMMLAPVSGRYRFRSPNSADGNHRRTRTTSAASSGAASYFPRPKWIRASAQPR